MAVEVSVGLDSVTRRVSPGPRAVSTTRYAPAAMERFDVVIVGGGPMGTAAARALSARGRAVVLLERFTLGNDKGSTAGTTRNFRLTYHDPLYVRMARLALERWRELEDQAGQELLRVVGGLDVGAGDRGLGARARGGRRAVRTAIGLRGRRAMADVAVPTGLALRLPARRRRPALHGGRQGVGQAGRRPWGRSARGDEGRVRRTCRRRCRGDDAGRCAPSTGRDRRSRLVDGLAPRAGRDLHWTCAPRWSSRRTSTRTRATSRP